MALVPDPSDPEWAGDAAVELTRAAAEGRRPAFLLDLAPEASDLAARFGATGAAGFAEAAAGEAELAGVAHRDGEQGFVYLPCGLRSSGRELAASSSLVALAERIRAADGVLLVVLDRRAARAAADAGWADGCVLLGDPRSASGGGELPAELPELGRIEPPRETAAAAPGRWGRHRKSSSFPALKAVGAAAVLAALAGAWWWYADRVTGTGTAAAGAGPTAEATAGTAASGPAAGETVPSRALAGPAGSDSADDGAAPPGTTSTAGATDTAPAEPPSPAPEGRSLGYSVLIASYASAPDARERVRSLASRADGLYFVAPTPVEDAVWYRVYAGSVGERDSAVALMDRLVAVGAKDEARPWDVRPVPWSFRVGGSFPDRGAAEARAEELRSRGLPAYVLRAGGDAGYRVYSGAYESREAAAVLEGRLRDAGVNAELVRRSGVVPSPGQ